MVKSEVVKERPCSYSHWWAVFHGLTAAAFRGTLLALAAGILLSASRRQVSGLKRLQPMQPKRESGAKIKQVSTARRLENRKRLPVRCPSCGRFVFNVSDSPTSWPHDRPSS